jgi:hypothetical protein
MDITATIWVSAFFLKMIFLLIYAEVQEQLIWSFVYSFEILLYLFILIWKRNRKLHYQGLVLIIPGYECLLITHCSYVLRDCVRESPLSTRYQSVLVHSMILYDHNYSTVLAWLFVGALILSVCKWYVIQSSKTPIMGLQSKICPLLIIYNTNIVADFIKLIACNTIRVGKCDAHFHCWEYHTVRKSIKETLVLNYTLYQIDLSDIEHRIQ